MESGASSPARSQRSRPGEITRRLVGEVGNTNRKIGVSDGPRLVNSWRMTSRREQTADEYGLVIETFLQTRGIQLTAIHGIAISKVVPPGQETLEWRCEQYFGRPAFFCRSAGD